MFPGMGMAGRRRFLLVICREGGDSLFPWRASQVVTERQRSWRMWAAKIHLTAAWQGRDECGTPWRVDTGGLSMRCLQGMMPLRQNRHAYERACA